jgi:hypothetical protein
MLFLTIGEYQKALGYLNKTVLLKPEVRYIKYYCVLRAYTGEYDNAMSYLDSLCSLNAFGTQCDIIKFYIKILQKDFKAAEIYYKKAITEGYRIEEDDNPYIAYLYKETRRKKEVQSILKNSIIRDEEWLSDNPNSVFDILVEPRLAASYALIEEKSKAMEKIEDRWTINNYDNPLFMFDKFPGFDNLRDKPEFKTLLKRVVHEQDSIRMQVKQMELQGEIVL